MWFDVDRFETLRTQMVWPDTSTSHEKDLFLLFLFFFSSFFFLVFGS